MPMWRCPHCGTPQAEAARCWVCRRSSTSCGTCRHFRRAVAGNLGYCGLDRTRRPLAGDELRGCWQEASPADHGASSATPPTFVPLGVSLRRDEPAVRPRLDFVEVTPTKPRDEATTRRTDGRGAIRGPSADPRADDRPAAPPPGIEEPRWSLWGELDR